MDQDKSYRVELQPATDHWMRGDRYGTVVKVTWVNGVPLYHVTLDKSGRTITLRERDIHGIL